MAFLTPAALVALLLATAPEASTPARMIRIVGGTFFAGVRPGSHGLEVGHDVTVADFLIDRTEVTVGAYLACVKARRCPPPSRKSGCNGATKGRLDHPINCVAWAAADGFCRWSGKRLPSSVEWERAARGKDDRIFPWGPDPPDKQLCWAKPGGRPRGTCPVGSYPAGASPFGVLDMAGNVAEWTSTRQTTSAGFDYVHRGGGFAFDPVETGEWTTYRVDLRSSASPKEAFPDLGFRCAKDVK